MNHFELLEINQGYNVNLRILTQQYFVMQAKYHPDKARSDQEKKDFLIMASELNKAYTVLKDDLKRAEYILYLNNIYIEDSKVRTRLPSDQLATIFEDLETVEKTEDPRILEQIYNQKTTEKELLITTVASAFKNSNLQDALDITISLKYLINLIDNIKMKLKNANSRNQ